MYIEHGCLLSVESSQLVPTEAWSPFTELDVSGVPALVMVGNHGPDRVGGRVVNLPWAALCLYQPNH